MRCERCGRERKAFDFPDDYGLSDVCFDCANELLPHPPAEQPREHAFEDPDATDATPVDAGAVKPPPEQTRPGSGA